MKITAIDCSLVSLPMRRPHRWASLTAPLGSYLLVTIRTDEGLSGWGEATVLAQWGGDFGRYYGETPTTVVHVIKDLMWPVLNGADLDHHRLIYEAMNKAVRGHQYAKLAVDAAMLDLVAQRAGIPVYELLGGQRRTEIPMGHSIGLMPVDKAVEEARAVADEGMRTVKLKTGEDLDRDLELIHKVHGAVGDRIEIAVDANQGWGPISVAQRMLSRIRDLDLRYVEQPVPGIDAMAELARRVDVPLMVDESVWTAYDLAEVARRGAASLASIYTTKAGGLNCAMQADSVALANGIATNVNGSNETGVGTLANVHLACAMASLGEGCLFPITGLSERRATEVAGAVYTDDVLADPLEFRDGCVPVPEGPGWGIAIDLEKVEHYTVDSTRIRE
jgi:muconate cycloisomerase